MSLLQTHDMPLLHPPPNPLPKVPARYYFGREVAASDRSIIKRYELPSRRYLGPTSMEAEMAFIMCNQAKVKGRR